jgi:uncharacterized membrane protein YjjB (DUF3815 family)
MSCCALAPRCCVRETLRHGRASRRLCLCNAVQQLSACRIGGGSFGAGCERAALGSKRHGLTLAPAAFFAALAIGLVAMVVDQRFNVPRIAMIVAPIIIMVPGIYAFEMIVLFNRGQMLDAPSGILFMRFRYWHISNGLGGQRGFSAQNSS